MPELNTHQAEVIQDFFDSGFSLKDLMKTISDNPSRNYQSGLNSWSILDELLGHFYQRSQHADYTNQEVQVVLLALLSKENS